MAYTPDSTGNVILIRADSAAKTTLSGTASAWYRVVGQAAVSIASPAAAYDADLGLWSVALPDAAVVSGVRQGWVTLRDGSGLIGSCPYLVEATTASRSTFDPATQAVETDAASRAASRADVSGLAVQASVDAGIAAVRERTDRLPDEPAAVGDVASSGGAGVSGSVADASPGRSVFGVAGLPNPASGAYEAKFLEVAGGTLVGEARRVVKTTAQGGGVLVVELEWPLPVGLVQGTAVRLVGGVA